MVTWAKEWRAIDVTIIERRYSTPDLPSPTSRTLRLHVYVHHLDFTLDVWVDIIVNLYNGY